MKMGMNPGNNAVAPEQANVSAPMADEQMSAGGMSTDFTFTIAPMTASSKSDAQDMMKSSDAYLRTDGPDVKASGHTSAMPAGSGN
jgi:hypothetical protein